MRRQKSNLLDALDRGWDLLERGDASGADRQARRALASDRRCAEAHTLLGAARLAEGDAKGALKCFRQALALDGKDVVALLHTADALIEPFEQYEEAVALCDRAIAVAIEPADRIDALLLKVEALLAHEDEDAARQALAALPPPPYPAADLHLRAGSAWFDLADLGAARRELERSLALDDALADAHHLLGLVHQQLGDQAAMVKSFTRTRALDLISGAPPWGLTPREFERTAERVLEELPPGILKHLANVPVIAADYPAIELVAEGSDPRMLGFFSGVPFPEHSNVGGDSPHLECIFLYQRNIERYARSREETLDEIRTTVLHETGHFFALDEEELEEIGLG